MKRPFSNILSLTALFAALCWSSFAAAQTTLSPIAQPITIGETLTLQSQVMGAERRVTVYLPLGYAGSDEDYPVLYLIDGGMEQDFLHVAGTTLINAIWGRSYPVIMVGIETDDRRAELIGEAQNQTYIDEFPTAGHSAKFRQYIRQEVMPLVEERYRTNDRRGVIGESLAGLFIAESALKEPELFQRHAAISPSLWWDDERLSHQAAKLLEGHEKPPNIYLSIANEGGEMESGFQRLVAALEGKGPMGEEWCALPRPDLTHATIYHATTPQALQFLFSPPPPPPEYAIEGFETPCVEGSGPE